MTDLFGKSRATINEHILNVYAENELSEESSVRKIGISDFSTKPRHYSLNCVSDMIIGISLASRLGYHTLPIYQLLLLDHYLIIHSDLLKT